MKRIPRLFLAALFILPIELQAREPLKLRVRGGEDQRENLEKKLKEAADSWTHDRWPGAHPDAWTQVRFIPEDGKPTPYESLKELYFLRSQEGRWTSGETFDPKLPDREILLFEFLEPSARVENNVEILSFKKTRLSVYYLRQLQIHNSDMLYLSRWDKPELIIPARRDSGWHVNHRLYPERWGKHSQNLQTAVTALKPREIDYGVFSPMTGVLNDILPRTSENICRGIDERGNEDLYYKPSYKYVSPYRHLNRHFTPLEHVLLISRAQTPERTSLDRRPNYSSAVGVYSDKKTNDPQAMALLNTFERETREDLKDYAKSLSDTLKDRSKIPQDRFIPEESRAVACLSRKLGKEAEASFNSKVESMAQLEPAARTTAITGFVAFWRTSLIEILDSYNQEGSKTVPGSLNPLKLEELDNGLKNLSRARLETMSRITDWAGYQPSPTQPQLRIDSQKLQEILRRSNPFRE